MTIKRKRCGKGIDDEVAPTEEESVNESFFKLPVRRCTFSAEVLDDEHDTQACSQLCCLMYDGVWKGQGGWLGSWFYLEDIDGCLFMNKSHKSSFP
ncbi:hypothetical protein F2Q69_00021242 [Brassica cretica]|uniref:Uncharacterized protein n=1 Tax=Brassica cretica TaxID=69181 RepID=A0A8S9QDB2_BRACR|nr:hypothetical protein F2Q69_00021242 [Brassica cretica]